MIASASFIVIILVLVLIEGFFSGSETAFTSASRPFLQSRAQRGDRRAVVASALLGRAERFLGTTLMGTNLAVVSATTLAQVVVSSYELGRWETLVNTVIMTPLILIVGELVPKSIGRAHADTLCLALAYPLRVAAWILSPLVAVTSRLAGLAARLAGSPGELGLDPYITREDLRAIAELAVEQGLVPQGAGTMLCVVFELDRKPISSIMTPLVDVHSVPIEASVADVEALAVKTGATRFPVYAGRIDEIVGVVDLRELLYAMAAHTGDPAPATAASATLSPHVQRNIAFVPETKPVGGLLHELRYHKVPMAAVVDEHGGVVGIVTTEDLIEEVVGEIHDERDRDASQVRRVTESVFECDGKLEIRELTEHLGIAVERNGFETVAGFVLKIAGRIPAVGDHFAYAGYRIEVLELSGRRVAKVRFRKLPPHDTPLATR